ncbi:hypothetical protein FGB62_167g010 [Gracilaria domingensis]|nr:hypothetical protein FGB62_167g010 [Gracilaria domingensis]
MRGSMMFRLLLSAVLGVHFGVDIQEDVHRDDRQRRAVAVPRSVPVCVPETRADAHARQVPDDRRGPLRVWRLGLRRRRGQVLQERAEEAQAGNVPGDGDEAQVCGRREDAAAGAARREGLWLHGGRRRLLCEGAGKSVRQRRPRGGDRVPALGGVPLRALRVVL